MNTQNKKKVLILCSGNSCRSQMAEALVNARMSESWQAWSAGTDPAGYVHLLAITVLKEVGIRHLGHSKSIADLPDKDFDLVISVCDEEVENCTIWLGNGERAHLNFPDPSLAEGSEEKRLTAFRSVLDDIDKTVLSYLRNYSG